jgi:DNA primase small subunit
LWIYSGRRGVHCWVSDERARKLSQEARRAIISYLEVVKGGEHTDKKVNLKSQLHPSLKYIINYQHYRKAYIILEKNFEKIVLEDMKVLDTKETWTKLVQVIPDEGFSPHFYPLETRKALLVEWDIHPDLTGKERWLQLVDRLGEKKSLANVKRDIILQYSYPRLDSNVSIGLNHLLKSPFCVHPKTGIL